jgi:hypothetical protein
MTPERDNPVYAPWVASILTGIEARAVEIRRLCDDIRIRVDTAKKAGEQVDYRLLVLQLATIALAYEAMSEPYHRLMEDMKAAHKNEAS